MLLSSTLEESSSSLQPLASTESGEMANPTILSSGRLDETSTAAVGCSHDIVFGSFRARVGTSLASGTSHQAHVRTASCRSAFAYVVARLGAFRRRALDVLRWETWTSVGLTEQVVSWIEHVIGPGAPWDDPVRPVDPSKGSGARSDGGARTKEFDGGRTNGVQGLPGTDRRWGGKGRIFERPGWIGPGLGGTDGLARGRLASSDQSSSTRPNRGRSKEKIFSTRRTTSERLLDGRGPFHEDECPPLRPAVLPEIAPKGGHCAGVRFGWDKGLGPSVHHGWDG